MKIPRALLLLFLMVLAGCGGGGGGGATAGQAYGLDARAAPSSVQIPTGASSSTQLRAIVAFPNLPRLPGPTFVTHAGDGSNRLFVPERGGQIFVFNNDPNVSQYTTFLNITSRVDSNSGEGGLLGLAFDPAYRSNGYFYVYYVHLPASGPRKVRISRFRDTSRGANTADPNSERIVLEFDHPNPAHFGGWIGFGPDGMLYISSGDADESGVAQNTSSFFGKILRIKVETNGSYTVPSDNPFAGSATWAYGFRNPWRCSFDRGNGNLWCGDVGQVSREEINRIEKGGNYGWSIYEGSLPYLNPTNRPASDFKPPVYEYDHTVGVAVIGGYVYRGSALPGLVGRFLYSDYISSNISAIQTDGNFNFVSNSVVASNTQPIHSFGEDEAGEVYAAAQQGSLLRFEAVSTPGTTGEAMPTTLSGTGLFSDLAQLTAAPGVIDYEVNAPFWSDGARKQRWFVLPAGATIGFAADGAWTFPVSTITVKHFELPLAGGGTTRVETRVMVHRTDGWRGFTYRWRTDGQDADLVAEGGASATYAGQVWNFPSRTQCLQCHTAPSRALGLNTRQFNGSHTYAASGRSDNQLRTLNHIGIFSSDIGATSQYSAMPNPADPNSGSIEARARAYLDTNCSICHQPGGGTPVDMDLRYSGSVSDLNIVGVPTSQSNGTRVVPGNPAGSDLWQRVQSSDANRRMPPVGVRIVDQESVQLLSTWITGLQ